MKAKVALLLSVLGVVTSGAAVAALNSPTLTRLVSQAWTLPTARPDLMDVVSSIAPDETLVPEPAASASVEPDDDDGAVEDQDESEMDDVDGDADDDSDVSEDSHDDSPEGSDETDSAED